MSIRFDDKCFTCMYDNSFAAINLCYFNGSKKRNSKTSVEFFYVYYRKKKVFFLKVSYQTRVFLSVFSLSQISRYSCLTICGSENNEQSIVNIETWLFRFEIYIYTKSLFKQQLCQTIPSCFKTRVQAGPKALSWRPVNSPNNSDAKINRSTSAKGGRSVSRLVNWDYFEPSTWDFQLYSVTVMVFFAWFL